MTQLTARRLTPNVRPFEGVAPGSPATMSLASGRAYAGLTITCRTAGNRMTRAQMESMISSVEIIINGRQQYDLTPAEIFHYQARHSLPISAGRLPLDFVQPWLKRADEQVANIMAIPPGVAFDIRVTLSPSAVTPTLELRRQDRPYANQAFSNQIITYSRFDAQATAAGTNRFVYNPSANRRIEGFTLFSGDVTSCRIVHAGEEIWDADKEVSDLEYLVNDYQAQNDTYDISPVLLSGLQGQAWTPLDPNGVPAVFEFEIQRAAGGGAIPVLVREIGPVVAG
jgi:hypothetical protein